MMNPYEKIIPIGVHPKKKQQVDGEAQWRSPTSILAAVSKVLGGDDLLIEILLRIDFPTTLVRAALVCRRWLRHASEPAFLHRFSELHPPCLLGFYINPGGRSTIPRFVPLLPQPPELDDVIRRASSTLDTYQSDNAWTYIRDCRKGSLLIEHRSEQFGSQIGVHNLFCPQRGMTIVPQFQCPPLHNGAFCTYGKMLSREKEGGGQSYLYVLMEATMTTKNVAHLYMLRDGVWCMDNSTIDQIPRVRLEPNSILVGHKIYLPAAKRDIIVLDLMTSSFATIQLPQGVEYGTRNTMLSRADDAANVYLIHVKKLQIFLWLHNAVTWLLVDNICLREMCPSLSMLHRNASLRLKHVGDNAEFVFLEMGRCILYWDVKHRTVRKVHDMSTDDLWLGDIFPFMMIWPPTFPVLKDDLARFAS